MAKEKKIPAKEKKIGKQTRASVRGALVEEQAPPVKVVRAEIHEEMKETASAARASAKKKQSSAQDEGNSSDKTNLRENGEQKKKGNSEEMKKKENSKQAKTSNENKETAQKTEKTEEELNSEKAAQGEENEKESEDKDDNEPEAGEPEFIKKVKGEENPQEKKESGGAPEPHLKKDAFRSAPENTDTQKFDAHPIHWIKEVVIIFFLMALVLSVLWFFLPTALGESIIWVMLTTILLGLSGIFRGYLNWKINIAFVRDDKLFYLQRESPLRHSLQTIDLDEVKFVYLEQKGFLQTFFDYGDIHVTNILSKEAEDIIMTNIWHARKVCGLLNVASFEENSQ